MPGEQLSIVICRARLELGDDTRSATQRSDSSRMVISRAAGPTTRKRAFRSCVGSTPLLRMAASAWNASCGPCLTATYLANSRR